MKHALIKVLIPIYNTADYLLRCVNSVRNQIYKELQIIMFDDGSSDMSPDICDKIAMEDDRVISVHQKNAGLAMVRNRSIMLAGIQNSGGYIGFVDSDDAIDEEMYSVMMEQIETDGTDVARCGYVLVDEHDCPLGDEAYVHYPDTIMSVREFYENQKYSHQNYLCNFLFSEKLLLDISFPQNRSYEDVAVFYRILDRVDRISLLSSSFYRYTQRTGSILHTDSLEKSFRNFCDITLAYREKAIYYEAKKDWKLMQIAIWDEARNVSQALSSNLYKSKLRKKVLQRKWNLVWYTIIHLNIHATKYTVANIGCLLFCAKLHNRIKYF